MTFTNTQIRAAILKTALTFENNPKLWDWNAVDIPRCGTRGCALGYIGFYLHAKSPFLHDIADSMGLTHKDQWRNPFYATMADTCGHKWRDDAASVVKALRIYADKYFPADAADDAPSLDPAFLRFKALFTESVEAA